MYNQRECDYKCVGELKQVQALYELLKRYKESDEIGSYYFREKIVDFELNGNVLSIHQETDADEVEEVCSSIEKDFPSIKVYYFEGEPGNDIFCTNDASGKYFPARYYLYDGKEWEWKIFNSIEEAAKYVSVVAEYYVPADIYEIENALLDLEANGLFMDIYEVNVAA